MEKVVLAMISLLRTTLERPELVVYSLSRQAKAPVDSEVLGTMELDAGVMVLEVFVRWPKAAKRMFIGHWAKA